MSTPLNSAHQPDSAHQPEFGIQRVYTKDLSFEAPNTPAIFKSNFQPQLNLNLQTSQTKLEGDDYEVVLKLTVTATTQDKTAFLAEVQQAGIFTLKSFTTEQIGPVLSITCPTILFPYAREAIANLVSHGSFPQLHLAPINFEALYHEQLRQQQAQHTQPKEAEKTGDAQ